MRTYLRHALAAAATFVPAYVAVTWLPFLLRPPVIRGGAQIPWTTMAVTDVATAFCFAFIGAVLALGLARRRLAAWRAVTLGRSALVGGLAGALAAGAGDWLLSPVLQSLVRDPAVLRPLLPWFTVANHLLTMLGGMLAVGLLYFPWLVMAPTERPVPADA